MTPGLVESFLVLLMSERASPPVVKQWVDRGGSAARRVFAMANWHEHGWEIDLDSAALSLEHEADLAARVAARLDPPRRDRGPLTPNTPFFWALAGRTALTDLLEVVDDKDVARMLSVLGPLPAANLEVRAELEQLRDALWKIV
jgi:hypothetical protein